MQSIEVYQCVPGEGYTAYLYLTDGSVRHVDYSEDIKNHKKLKKIKTVAEFREKLCLVERDVAIDTTGRRDPYECYGFYDLYYDQLLQENAATEDPLEPAKKVKNANFIRKSISDAAFYWGEDERMEYYHSAISKYDEDGAVFNFLGIMKDGSGSARIEFPSAHYVHSEMPEADKEIFLAFAKAHKEEIIASAKKSKPDNGRLAREWKEPKEILKIRGNFDD